MLKRPHGTTRRGALRLLAAAAGVVATWRPELALGSVAESRTFARPPSYVPSTFRFRRRFQGLPDGFSGETDVTYAYVNPEAPLANAFPLLVCESIDARRWLGATAPTPGRTLMLVGGDDEMIAATYHDGVWWLKDDGTLEWNMSNVHSLSFSKEGVTYGIRGVRSNGVTLDELKKVALSLA